MKYFFLFVIYCFFNDSLSIFQKKNISWCFIKNNHSSFFNYFDIISDINQAFITWENLGIHRFYFKYCNNVYDVDIVIKICHKDHLFHIPLRKNDLAIKYIDEDIIYSCINSNFINTNYSIKSIFLHEIGHILGLEHSKNPKSIMYDFYRGNIFLSQIDINNYFLIYKDKSFKLFLWKNGYFLNHPYILINNTKHFF